MTRSEHPRRSDDLLPPYFNVPTRKRSEFDPPSDFLDSQESRDPIPVQFRAGHTGWLVAGYDLAKKVLSDRRFSVRPERAQAPNGEMLQGYSAPGLFHLEDPPEHTRLRSTVTSEFTPAKTRAHETGMADIASSCVDEFIGANKNKHGDIVSGFAIPFPALVMAEYLGMPAASRDMFIEAAQRRSGHKNRNNVMSALFRLLRQDPSGTRNLLYRSARQVVTRTSSGGERQKSMVIVSDFMKSTIAQVRGNDSFLGRLGERTDITKDEAAGIGAQVLIAGSMVPASMLGLAIKLLLQRPGALAVFTQGPEETSKATEEVFRYLSFETQPRIRVASEDVKVGDTWIRAGQMVAVALEAANRDPREFDEPDKLLFERDPSKHLAFGWGSHQCLGQNLARSEIRIALETFGTRLPDLRLAPSKDASITDDTIVHSITILPVFWGSR